MDSGQAKDFIQLQRASQEKNKGVRARGGTWGVHNNTVDPILLGYRESGGERQ